MRTMVLLAAMFGMLQLQPALSQANRPAAPVPTGGNDLPAPPCDGDIANVRLIEISPTGTMDGYLKALDAHRSWYRAHGFKDNQIYAARVMVLDPATNTLKYSNTQMLSFHIRPPFMPGSIGHDKAWDDFHQSYRENSNIKTTYNICLPKNR